MIPVRVTFNILSGNKLYTCQSSTILVKSQETGHTYSIQSHTSDTLLRSVARQENLAQYSYKKSPDQTGINITGAIMFDYEEFQLE